MFSTKINKASDFFIYFSPSDCGTFSFKIHIPGDYSWISASFFGILLPLAPVLVQTGESQTVQGSFHVSRRIHLLHIVLFVLLFLRGSQ